MQYHSTYLFTSESWPPNAITVLIELRTSSAIAPAMPYATNSFFASLDAIWRS